MRRRSDVRPRSDSNPHARRSWLGDRVVCWSASPSSRSSASARRRRPGSATATIWQGGTPITGAPSMTESVAGLMRDQRIADRTGQTPVHPRPEAEADFRSSLPENPRSPDVARLPGGARSASTAPSTPQTVGTSFTGATIADTPGFVPPDTMGAVGPTQFVVTVNGRFRSFSKTTGLADGALNVDPDVFFGSVRSDNHERPAHPLRPAVGPLVHHDDRRERPNNRILIAVSSGSTITSASNFTFFDIPSDTTAPTRSDLRLRRLRHARDRRERAVHRHQRVLRHRARSRARTGTSIRKSSVLGAGPIVVTVFRSLATRDGDGPFTPQGVDNVDPNATEGSFIGVSNASSGSWCCAASPTRAARRASPPTSSSPCRRPPSRWPRPDRAARRRWTRSTTGCSPRTFRNGQLWTAHNIGVNSSGRGELSDPHRPSAGTS